MNACASLGPVRRSGVSADIKPMVMIDNVPEPRLIVESTTVEGPLDVRSARFIVIDPDASPGVFEHWLCSQVVISWPMRLVDDEIYWAVLIQGELREVESCDSAGVRSRRLELVDTWTDTISMPTNTIWSLNPDGSPIQQPTGKLMIGPDGNRSSDTFDVDGLAVHVIHSGSHLSWSVQSALETVSAFAGLDLSLRGLPAEVAKADLDTAIDLSNPTSTVLKSILESYSLTIRRDMIRQGGAIVERRAVLPISSGRPIRVVWADDAQPLGDALVIKSDRPAQTAQLWIARADGWLVESTFELIGGWAPALQGQPDDEYDKKKSSDFATYANVYRKWVLNEDDFFTGPPYNHGPAFDLTAFFGTGAVDPQPLEFQSNVTLQDDGSPLKPIVEISTNSGSTWLAFSQSVIVLDGRAGVYLNPSALTPAFLAAAKAGSARVRVTAGLQSPLPVEQPRWNGNAFSTKVPPLVLDVSETFRFQRVDSNSIHYADVEAGSQAADEVDHTYKILDWLVQKMTRHAQGGEGGGGRATLELAGTWPMLRPGDRLLDARGPGVAADGQAQAVARHGAAIVSYETRFSTNHRNGRTTKIDLTF
jgi:hypothetical protein